MQLERRKHYKGLSHTFWQAEAVLTGKLFPTPTETFFSVDFLIVLSKTLAGTAIESAEGESAFAILSCAG